jgi:hypothetical protein
MTSLLGKYWPLHLASVAVIFASLIAAIVVQLQLLERNNWLAIWLFKFVNDWAAPLSASAAILLIIAVFMTIRETRRRRALYKIQSWANNAIMLLKAPSTEESPALKLAELNTKFQIIKDESAQVLAESKQISRELNDRVEKAVSSILEHADAFLEGDMTFDVKVKTPALLEELSEVTSFASKL